MGLFDVFKRKEEKPEEKPMAEPKSKKPRKAKVVKTAKDLALSGGRVASFLEEEERSSKREKDSEMIGVPNKKLRL